MEEYYRTSPKKYRLYLNSAFRDLTLLRRAIVQRIAQTGLFYYFLGAAAEPADVETTLQHEIDDSDVFILLVGDSLDSFQVRGIPVARLEFEYARKIGKPILAYCVEDGINGSVALRLSELEGQVLKVTRYRGRQPSDDRVAGDIISDALNLIISEPCLSCWVRADMSRADVDKILVQKETMDQNMLKAGRYIQRFETQLSQEDRDRLVGPLIDVGLRPNFSGQAYRFAIGRTPETELNRDDLDYEYCIHRFTQYESGVIYDRKLDISWYQVRGQNFSWREAMEWQGYLTEENRQAMSRFESDSNPGGSSKWQVPRIEQLMTLITYERYGKGYIDNTVFSQDFHSFWSSTKTENNAHAFYIEAVLGQVLKDLIDPILKGRPAHRKFLLLYTKGRIAEPGQHVEPPLSSPFADATEALRQANQSRRIFGVYMAVSAPTQLNEESETRIRDALSDARYHLVSQPGLGSTVVTGQDAMRREMENADYLVLVLNSPVLKENSRVIKEINLARDLRLPLSTFHNLSSRECEDLWRTLELPAGEIGIPGQFEEATDLPQAIITALKKHEEYVPVPGWIQQRDFSTINSSMEMVNRANEKLESAERSILAFVQHAGGKNLRRELEYLGILTKRPEYGQRTRFLSKGNPMQRLGGRDDEADVTPLPILYEKVLDRFRPLSTSSWATVVYDRYLHVRWWTRAKKGASYEDALAFARDISLQERETWRLPTVEELLTLMTRVRGSRKYMDEIVFPGGRWFWTSTHPGNKVFFVDFNYVQGAVGQEDLVPGQDLPSYRKKSVLLVSDGGASLVSGSVDAEIWEQARMDEEPSRRYEVSKIRDLIKAAFDIKELGQFCQDRPLFRLVLDDLGQDGSLNDLTEILIMYCEKQALYPELLAEILDVHPMEYRRHFPK